MIIPHKLHNAVIGAKGQYVRAIMEECGGVLIRFPNENTTSDKVSSRVACGVPVSEHKLAQPVIQC